MNVNIYTHKTHKDAVIPQIAYGGTSAAFDLVAVEDTTIRPGEAVCVENGLNISIDENEPFYMVIMDRSSMGFKKDLQVFQGVIDAGYTGPMGVKMRNLGNEVITIKKGDKYAQVIILEKHTPNFIELNNNEFKEFEDKQQRGAKGFGSSGK